MELFNQNEVPALRRHRRCPPAIMARNKHISIRDAEVGLHTTPLPTMHKTSPADLVVLLCTVSTAGALQNPQWR